MIRRAIIGAIVVASLVVLGAPARAHHSFAEFYIEKDTVEIEGNVVQFQYKNPHAYLFVEAPDSFGMQHVYAAEWQSVSRLESDGITNKTIRPGDRVRIWGSPGRKEAEYRIRLKRIQLADGRMWGNQGRPEAR